MPMPNDAAEAEPLVIRPAEAADLTGIVSLFVDDETGGHGDSLDPALGPLYAAAFARIEASPNDTVFVAVLGARIVGTYQLTFVPSIVHRGRLRAMVESVHVDSRLRSRGIGAAMMRHAEAAARAGGAGILQLTSNKKRLDAHRFYERLGFAKSHEGFKMDLDTDTP